MLDSQNRVYVARIKLNAAKNNLNLNGIYLVFITINNK